MNSLFETCQVDTNFNQQFITILEIFNNIKFNNNGTLYKSPQYIIKNNKIYILK